MIDLRLELKLLVLIYVLVIYVSLFVTGIKALRTGTKWGDRMNSKFYFLGVFATGLSATYAVILTIKAAVLIKQLVEIAFT